MGTRNQLIEAINQFGRIDGATYLLGRFIDKISLGHCRLYKYYLIAQPISKKPMLASHRGKNIYIKLIESQTEGFNNIDLNVFSRPIATIESRIKQKAFCFIAYNNEQEVIGFIWFNKRSHLEDEVRCKFVPLPTDYTVWDYDIYIKPEFRMSFAFMKLWDESNKYLTENNIDWTLSRISAFNMQSFQSHKRLGAIIVDTAIFLKIFNIQITFMKKFPYIHISLSDSFIPTLTVKAPKQPN